jgi:hypothetical protein
MTTDPVPGSGPPAGRSQDRTLKRTTITVAAVSLGLSGVFTYQAANAPVVSSAAVIPVVTPAPTQVTRENDDDAMPTSAGPPVSAPRGQPVAVSGGS